MICPKCEADESQVTDTRAPATGNSIRRRRRCLDCGHRWTTHETPAAERHALAKAVERERERFRVLLTDVAQILDGWHADGTAWSEWDESVRERVSEVLKGGKK